MIPLVVTEDNNGRILDGVRRPNFMDNIVLVGHAGVTLTVPSGANHVLMSCSTDFFVRYNSSVMASTVYAASSVEASGVCVGTAFELNPVLRTLTSVTGMSFIAPAAGHLTLSFFG